MSGELLLGFWESCSIIDGKIQCLLVWTWKILLLERVGCWRWRRGHGWLPLANSSLALFFVRSGQGLLRPGSSNLPCSLFIIPTHAANLSIKSWIGREIKKNYPYSDLCEKNSILYLIWIPDTVSKLPISVWFSLHVDNSSCYCYCLAFPNFPLVFLWNYFIGPTQYFF